MAQSRLIGISARGRSLVVDDEDADLLSVGWHPHTSSDLYTAYARHGGRRYVLCHRVVMERMLGGQIPAGMTVDHINGDGFDNRRGNLRLATRSQNGANRRVRTSKTSPFLGVHWDKCRSRWRAAITVNGHCSKLGSFDDEVEAARAYNAAAAAAHGAYARLNEV